MKELIKGTLIIVFMVNMVHVHQENSKAKSIAKSKASAARYAKHKATRKAMYKELIMHEVHKDDTPPAHRAYLANN